MSEKDSVNPSKIDKFVNNLERAGIFEILSIKTALSLTGLMIVVVGWYFLIAVVNTPVLAGSDADNIRGLYMLCIVNFMMSGAVLMASWYYKSIGE